MWTHLTRPEACAIFVVGAILVILSVGQHRQLEAIRLEQQKAEYVDRIRATHVILEDGLLRSAYLTSADGEVRQLARQYLEEPPQ